MNGTGRLTSISKDFYMGLPLPYRTCKKQKSGHIINMAFGFRDQNVRPRRDGLLRHQGGCARVD